jgi:hypothetical protein
VAENLEKGNGGTWMSIFFTQPKVTARPPEVDEVYNYQILGFAEGRSEWEAKSKLLKKSAWIEATGYNPREICSAKVVRSK